MNDKTIWDVGETVKEKKEESPFMIKTCPFRKREYGFDVCCNEAKCGLWSEISGMCSISAISSVLESVCFVIEGIRREIENKGNHNV